MQIRKAEISDVDSIAHLLSEMRDETVDVASIKTQLTQILDDANRTILVIDDEGVVGMAVVNLVFKLPKVEARFDEVIVAAQMRGKNYGSMLVEACEAWSWGRGADAVELTSRPSREAANAMYRKLGYNVRETNVYHKEKN